MKQKTQLFGNISMTAIDELKDMDLVTTENGYNLTDAGKIARL